MSDVKRPIGYDYNEWRELGPNEIIRRGDKFYDSKDKNDVPMLSENAGLRPRTNKDGTPSRSGYVYLRKIRPCEDKPGWRYRDEGEVFVYGDEYEGIEDDSNPTGHWYASYTDNVKVTEVRASSGRIQNDRKFHRRVRTPIENYKPLTIDEKLADLHRITDEPPKALYEMTNDELKAVAAERGSHGFPTQRAQDAANLRADRLADGFDKEYCPDDIPNEVSRRETFYQSLRDNYNPNEEVAFGNMTNGIKLNTFYTNDGGNTWQIKVTDVRYRAWAARGVVVTVGKADGTKKHIRLGTAVKSASDGLVFNIDTVVDNDPSGSTEDEYEHGIGSIELGFKKRNDQRKEKKEETMTDNNNSVTNSIGNIVVGGFSMFTTEQLIDLAARLLAEWRLSEGDVEGAKMIIKESTRAMSQTLAPFAMLGMAHAASKSENAWAKSIGVSLIAPLEASCANGFKTVLKVGTQAIFSGRLTSMEGIEKRIQEAEERAVKKVEKVEARKKERQATKARPKAAKTM